MLKTTKAQTSRLGVLSKVIHPSAAELVQTYVFHKILFQLHHRTSLTFVNPVSRKLFTYTRNMHASPNPANHILLDNAKGKIWYFKCICASARNKSHALPIPCVTCLNPFGRCIFTSRGNRDPSSHELYDEIITWQLTSKVFLASLELQQELGEIPRNSSEFDPQNMKYKKLWFKRKHSVFMRVGQNF